MRFGFLVLSFLFIPLVTVAQPTTGYLTDDGGWCWFSDPRAVMIDGEIVTGWVKTNGTIEAGRFNPGTRSVQTDELYYLLERDDHDNPAFVVTGDRRVLALYTRHGKKDLFINSLPGTGADDHFSSPQMLHPLSEEEVKKFPRARITYANPFTLKAENNRIYCFGRWAGFKPNMMWSDDNGNTWSQSKVFITNYPFDGGNRPYVKYASDGDARVHLTFTDGHPRNEPTNSVYYAYYEGGGFYRAGGKKIVDMDAIPFEPKDASIVYAATEAEGRAWVADVGQDELRDPVILYTRSPDTTNHEYWYARFTEGEWVSKKICDSGKWFPQTPEGMGEKEPHYFGGLALHPDNANVVYLSRQVDGVFEIERWETDDRGTTWSSTAITEQSTLDNVRPYLPIGLKQTDPEVVLWMETRKYVHYTNYEASIKYSIRQVK